MARDAYDETKKKNVYKQPQKKTKKTVVKKPQSSSVSKPGPKAQAMQRMTDTSTGRRPAQTQKPASTARQQQTTRSIPAPGRAAQNEYKARQNAVPKTAQEMREERERTEKAKKAAEHVMNNNTSSYYGGSMQPRQTKFGKAAADTVEQSLRQAGAAENRMFWESVNGITDPRIDPFYNNVVSQEEAEKGQAKIDAHIESAAKKIEDSTEELERIKEGHGWLGQRTLEAISSGVGMLTDYAWGPAALAHMFIRSTGTARGQVTKQAAAMRQNLESTGLYTEDELDEMFKDVEKWDMANAMVNGGIEMASERLFTGAGLAKKAFGPGIIDRAAGRLFGKFAGRTTSGFLGKLALGTAEEITEEEVGGPLQVWAANQIYGKKLQAMNEDASRRALQVQSDYMLGQVQNESQARYLASQLSSQDFLDETSQSYMDAGFGKEESDRLSSLTVDYLTASLTGDTESMQTAQDEMVSIMTSGDKSMLEKWTLKDAIDVAVSTGIMTSVSGLQGSVTTAQQGKAARMQLGADGVRNLAEVTMNWDADNSDSAKAVVDRLDNGNDITDTQVAEYVSKASRAALESQQDEDAKWRTADARMKAEDLRIAPAQRAADGSIVLLENTERRYDQILRDSLDRYQDSKSEIGTEQIELGADLAAAQMTGVITAEQINELAKAENKGARQVFQDVTGIDLDQFNKYDRHGLKIAETNIAMRKGLFASAAENIVESARAEQEAWNDEARQEMSRTLRTRMEGSGAAALDVVLQNVDPRDRDAFKLTGAVARDVYRYARTTLDDWDTVKRKLRGIMKGVNVKDLKGIYDAAKADKAKAENKYHGKAVRAQEEMMRHSLNNDDPAYVPGKFENESAERTLDFEQEKLLNDIAVELEVNVVMTDSLDRGENGRYDYKTRTIMLNSQNTMGENLKYIFSHEVTHHLAVYAPEEYLKLSRFVMDRWYKQNPAEYTRQINGIKELYKARKDQDLTDEEALEELIADGTKDFWHDESFAEKITQEEPSLAKAIINSIKNILTKLRNILAHGNIRDEATRNGFFDSIDAYDTAYSLWLDAYNAARNGQAQQAIDEWQDRANEAPIREGMTDEERYNNLRTKAVKVIESKTDSLELSEEQFEKLREAKLSEAREAAVKLARKIGVKGVYNNQEIEFEFEYSYGGLEESAQKQAAIKSNEKYVNFVNLMYNIRPIVENARLIRKYDEAEYLRDNPGHKTNENLKYTYVLVSGLSDGVNIIPVKLTVMEYKERNRPRLHVAMTTSEIEKMRIIADRQTDSQGIMPGESATSFNVMLADLLPQINDKELKKHIPKQFYSSKSSISDVDTRFSLSEPVERVRDLIAVHNLTADKLRGDFRLGGFPMPSIAVTNQNHENFGNISLLFNSDTIDPQKDRANRVYSADAWTPTVPATEYEADTKIAGKAYRKVSDLVGGNDYLSYGISGDLNYQTIEGDLKRFGGYDSYISRMMEKPYMQYAFLKDTGKDVEIPMKEGNLQGHGADVWAKLDAALPEITRAEAYNMSYEEAMKYDPIIRNILSEDVKEKLGDEKVGKLKSSMLYEKPFAWGKVTNYLADLVKYRENVGIIQETDSAELKKILSEQIDKNEFRAWLNSMFDGIIANEGVYNGRDPFTPSGSSRSFNQLYYPATLEGILRAMKEQGEKNVASYTSTKTLRADTAKTFKSLDDIRKNKDKLQSLTEEEHDAIYKEIDDNFYEILNSIRDSSGSSDDIFVLDNIADVMSECAQLQYSRPEQIIKKYKEYGYTVSEEQANDILALFDAIKNMPVNMFEAKPRRAVGFNEVKAAILPNDIDADIRSELELMEIPIYEYDPQAEGDRARAVNEAADAGDLRFSIAAMDGHDEAWYNRNGWIAVNDVLDSRELESLFTEARYKKRRIMSNDGFRLLPLASRNAIGSFVALVDNKKNPYVDRIWQFIDEDRDILDELTEVFRNGREGIQDLLSDETLVSYFGEESVKIHRRSNYPTYNENSERFEREYGRKPAKNNKELQNRRRSEGSSKPLEYTFEEIETDLKENFSEYRTDKENLRIATEAIDDLQRIRLSISEPATGDVSGRWGGDVQVRTIAKGITSSLVNEGYIDFVGQKVKGPEDLAKLCQVLRDPRFETFRLILTKGDKIVSFQSVSARMPGLSPIHNEESDYEYYSKIKTQMQQLGADGYYLLHNHPSGRVDASRDDLVVTAKAINAWGREMFKGHVILDHDKYGFIEDIPAVYEKTGERLPSFSEVDIPGQKTFDLIHEPEMDHPVLDEAVHNSEDVARVGAFVNASENVSVIIYMAASGQVRGIQEISNETLANEDITDFLREQAVDFGSMYTAIYSTTTKDDVGVTAALLNLYKNGALLDVVRPADYVSFAEQGISRHGDPSVMGRSKTEIKGRTFVYDSAAGTERYSLAETDANGKVLTPNQTEYFQKSKARDALGRLVQVFHTTNHGGFTIFDPSYSDDSRSLFFSDNWDVSQTYGNYANSRFYYFDINNTEDVKKYLDAYSPDRYFITQEQFDEAGGWEADFVDFENITNGEQSDFEQYLENPDGYIAIIGAPDYSPGHKSYADTWVSANSPDELVRELHDHFGRMRDNYPGNQRGYYACYLNLENPLIVDANGAYWNSIPYGEGGKSVREDAANSINGVTIFWEYDSEERLSGVSISIYGETKNADGEWETYETGDYIQNYSYDIDDLEELQSMLTDDIYDLWSGTYGYDEDLLTDLMAQHVNRDGDVEAFFDDIFLDAEGKVLDKDDYDESSYNTRELARIAQNSGHDGVIIKNCRDLGGMSAFEGTDETSDIYIAFSSNQVKDINNENPTENPDIRYALADDEDVMNVMQTYATSTDELWSNDPIEAEGRVRHSLSKKDFINGITDVWRPEWKTEGKILKEKAVENSIREVIMGAMRNSNTNAKYRKQVVDDTMLVARKAYNYMKNDDWTRAGELLYEQAHNIIDNLEFFGNEDRTEFERYKNLRAYLRHTKITVPKNRRSDIDYQAYRKRNYGKILLGNNGTAPDVVWQHLNELWPEVFTEDIKGDIPGIMVALEAAVEVYKPVTYSYTSEECEDFAGDIANALWDILYEGEAYKSLADRFDERSRAMKQRHQEAMRKVRENYKEKLTQQALEAKRSEYEKLTAQKEKLTDRYEKKISDIKENQAEKEAARKYRAEHRRLYDRVLKEYKDLTYRLLHPVKDKTKNIPEQIRQPLAEMLYCFDLEKETSKRLEELHMLPTRVQLNFRQLKDSIEQVIKEDPTAYEFSDIHKFLKDKMTDIADRVDGKGIDALENDDIEVIKDLLTGLNAAIRNYQQVEVDGEKYQAQQMCEKVGEAAAERRKLYGPSKKYNGAITILDNIVNMGELTPVYFFQEIGGMYDMYRQIRKGFDTYVRNESDLVDKLADILKPFYKTNRKGQQTPGSEIEEWRHTESAETYDLTYGPLRLTVAQKMSLYCLAKRAQAKGHMLSDNGGVVASESTAGKMRNRLVEGFKGKFVDNQQLPLTPADIDTIVSTLTQEQKDVADALQRLMSEDMAKLGNEASVKLTGVEMYKEDNYFPIKILGDTKGTDLDNIGMREKVRNPGFSNPLVENASNPIILDDIFTVVASHCNEMNLYASYAVPLTAFMKVYNGSILDENGKTVKVKQILRRTYGDKAITYIENFLDDINGNSFKRQGGLDDVLDKALGQAKKAAVFANLRVAAQQPTAIVRAAAVLNPKYFKGVRPSTKATKEMIEHCPIAQWKAWGYYDTHFGRSIEDVMMGRNVSSKMDKLMSDIYGQLDNMTWGMIWQAVKNEIRATHKGIDENSQEFWDLCSERASYVFDTTQVVDSPLHRSNDMRSKNGLVKQLTSFQAEPTLSFNVLRKGILDTIDALKKGDKAKAGKVLARVLGVWIGQAITVAFAQSLVDALRRKGHKKEDDDEDEALAWYQEMMKYFQRNWWHNLSEGVNPIYNIYFVKEFVPAILNALEGEYVYGSTNLTFQWVDTLTNGITQVKKKWEKGDAYSKTWYDCFTELLGGVGYFFGIPVKTMMRGTKNAFHWANKIFGMNVFADDGSADKAFDNIIDNFRKEDEDDGEGKTKSKSKGDSDSSGDTEALTDENLKEHIEQGVADADETFKKRSEKAAEKAEGKTGRQRDQALWDVICDGYTNAVESGNMATIYRMRSAFAENGGDVEWFDSKITEKMKGQYKKTIGTEAGPGASARQEVMRDYLLEHGVSEAEISDICYHSATAKDLKAALRMGNEEYIIDELTPLIRAGLTYEDFEKLYKYRNYGAQNYDGKYTDPKYKMSTGTYIWPTDGVISSGFGYRSAPTAGASTYHQGIDIAAPQGTPVVACDGGVVIEAGYNGGYGNSVGIRHDDGTISYYNHLYAWNVKEGDHVGQGQQIGQVGSTGVSTGPHLDFRLYKDGDYLNPEEYLNKKAS